MMEGVQALIEKVKMDIQDEKSEEEIFQSLIPFLGKNLQTDGKVAEWLTTIPDAKVARLLQQMLEFSKDKKVRKTIKRSLYRLKSKGIEVEEVFQGQESSVLRPLEIDPPRGYGNGIDFWGDRVLLLVVPHTGRRWMVVNGVVNDRDGLIDVFKGEVGRKEFRSLFEEMKKSSPTPFVEIDPSYVGFLFGQAYQLTIEKEKIPPQHYLDSKSEIEKVRKEYEQPLIYSCLKTDELIRDERLLKRGGDLLKSDVFSIWKVEEDEVRPYADAVWEAEESKIVLNPAQKEARFQGIYQKALSELFTGERRLLYKRRLEETAYFLFKLGREEEARIALSVAIDLEKPLNVIQPNPFLFQLVVKSIFALLAEAYEKKSKDFSLIAKP